MITRGDVQYEGSIEIPADLMAAVDLWPGEKVLVASVTSGNRLVIMSFALSDKPIIPKKIVCNEHNEIIS